MKLKETITAALREPLVHFLIAGLLVFIFASQTGANIDPESRRIVVNAKQIQRLTENWQKAWSRLPTPTELDDLIREDIKDEIYNREALRLGLDKNDTVIRRRLRAKMEYLAISAAESQRPSDAELQTWLDNNVQKYSIGNKYSFDQIYFADDEEAPAQARAASALARLRAGADWHELGDEISLPPAINNENQAQIGRIFGIEFATELQTLTIGEWKGPVASGFGLHLIRLNAVQTGAKPRLAEVRTQVENDWRAETALARERQAYQKLLDGYSISIERPK